MKPLNNKIQLDIKEVKIGAIQSDAIEEHGTIIAVGRGISQNSGIAWNEEKQEYCPEELIGKTLYFKAWAVDVITKGQEKFYFISADSDAICAISD